MRCEDVLKLLCMILKVLFMMLSSLTLASLPPALLALIVEKRHPTWGGWIYGFGTVLLWPLTIWIMSKVMDALDDLNTQQARRELSKKNGDGCRRIE